jgi:O-antigen/teichoic acid export membrane protein
MHNPQNTLRFFRAVPNLTLQLLRSLISTKGSLSQKAVRSGFWVLFSYGFGRVLNILRTVILARLLLPADFGLMGLATIATGFISILTEIGIGPALIYKQDESDEILSTAWFISLIRGIVLCGLTIAISGPVSAFFETPELAPILQVMAFTFIANGLNSIGLILLEKELDFGKLAILDLTANIISLISAVIAAWILRNTWALVIGTFAQVIVMLLGSYLIHPFKPKWKWSVTAARNILNYGKYIMGVQIVSFGLTQGDNTLVGKLLGTTDLGLYSMAYNLASLPATSISHLISKVAFPAYAKIKDDLATLRDGYLKVLRLTALLAVPAAGGLFALAPELVRLLYGEKWMPMVPALMIMCIYGLERAINSPAGALLNATGRPKTLFHLQLIKLALLALFIYPLTIRFGILGTSIAGGLVAIMISANVFPIVARILECNIQTVLRQIFTPLVATLLMMAGIFAVKLSGLVVFNPLTTTAVILLSCLVYIAIIAIIDRPILLEITMVARSYMNPPDQQAYQIP